jgi:hypothetical protein
MPVLFTFWLSCMDIPIQGKFMKHRNLSLPRTHGDKASAAEITITAQVLNRMLEFRPRRLINSAD